MRDFAATRIDASEGDSVQISASGVDPFGAQVYLFADEEYGKIKDRLEAGERVVLMEFEDMKTLTPDNPEWTAIIPADGGWFLLYQPGQVADLDVQCLRETS